MNKYSDYYYTVRVEELRERNNSTPIKMYKWFIRQVDGVILEESEELFDDKDACIWDCIDHIKEYYSH